MNVIDTLAKAIIPPEYQGKILLASVRKNNRQVIVLRAGDLWHSAILRNLEAEVRSLGWEDAEVEELGGAHLSIHADNSIHIWGSSDVYGACDREFAAQLVRELWPEKKVTVSI